MSSGLQSWLLAVFIPHMSPSVPFVSLEFTYFHTAFCFNCCNVVPLIITPLTPPLVSIALIPPLVLIGCPWFRFVSLGFECPHTTHGLQFNLLPLVSIPLMQSLGLVYRLCFHSPLKTVLGVDMVPLVSLAFILRIMPIALISPLVSSAATRVAASLVSTWCHM